MAKANQSGFTLIELMLVFAIMSMLSIIAFRGQAALRSQTQFDADVEKVMASIAKVRDDTSAGLNDVGNGTGVGEACNAGDTGSTVVAGEAFIANNNLIAGNGSAFESEYFKANQATATPDACPYVAAQSIAIPSGIEVGATSQGQELFVRTSNGGLDVCPEPLSANLDAIFAAGQCASGSWTLNLTDTSGHASQIIVDQSGLAKRVN